LRTILNFGFAILGADRRERVRAVVEHPRVQAYTNYVNANVLAPLGMTSTTLEPSRVPVDRLRTAIAGRRAMEERAAALPTDRSGRWEAC
jgi:CubicO group peptidase (beta-lactamase class C family)